MAAAPAPIAGLYLLTRSDAARPSLERLKLPDALDAITRNAFHLADEPAAIARHAFERASALAALAQVSRLRSPTGFDALDATRALLEGVDAGSSRAGSTSCSARVLVESAGIEDAGKHDN